MFTCRKSAIKLPEEVLISVSKIVYDAGHILSEYSHGINLYLEDAGGEIAFESRSSLNDAQRLSAFESVAFGLDELLRRMQS